MNARMKLCGIEGFAQEIVSAGVYPFEPIVSVSMPRHDHDRHEAGALALFQLPAQVETESPRSKQVQHDEIWVTGRAGAKHILRLLDNRDRMTFPGQQTFEVACTDFIVIRYENRRFHGHCLRRSAN